MGVLSQIYDCLKTNTFHYSLLQALLLYKQLPVIILQETKVIIYASV